MQQVLIVEDDPNIRKFMKVNLVARGYAVAEAQNAREGLAQLLELTPALLLLDIKLPDMSGWELLRIITTSSSYPRLPVIVITASLSNLPPDHAEFQNLSKVLIKPLSATDLADVVRQVLGRETGNA